MASGQDDSIQLDAYGETAAAAAAEEEEEEALRSLMSIDVDDLINPLASDEDADSEDGTGAADSQLARRKDTRPRQTARRGPSCRTG